MGVSLADAPPAPATVEVGDLVMLRDAVLEGDEPGEGEGVLLGVGDTVGEVEEVREEEAPPAEAGVPDAVGVCVRETVADWEPPEAGEVAGVGVREGVGVTVWVWDRVTVPVWVGDIVFEREDPREGVRVRVGAGVLDLLGDLVGVDVWLSCATELERRCKRIKRRSPPPILCPCHTTPKYFCWLRGVFLLAGRSFEITRASRLETRSQTLRHPQAANFTVFFFRP